MVKVQIVNNRKEGSESKLKDSAWRYYQWFSEDGYDRKGIWTCLVNSFDKLPLGLA